MFEGTDAGLLRSFVVWIPILDDDARTAAVAASEAFRGVAAPQYWDTEQRLGRGVALGLAIEDWVAWDIFLFYAPDAVWTDVGPPAPAAVLAQAPDGVIAFKGTLPREGEAVQLPPALRDRVEVVGTIDELAGLLRTVAARFT